MAVSTYTYDSLPPEEQQALPAAEDLKAALDSISISDNASVLIVDDGKGSAAR